MYVNKVENRIPFNIKAGYYIQGPDFLSSKGVCLCLIFGCDDPTYNPSHGH